MVRVLIVVITTLVVTGCTSLQWTHPTKLTQEEFNHDAYDCKQDAYQYTKNIGFAGKFGECMRMKYGWKQEVGQPRTNCIGSTGIDQCAKWKPPAGYQAPVSNRPCLKEISDCAD